MLLQIVKQTLKANQYGQSKIFFFKKDADQANILQANIQKREIGNMHKSQGCLTYVYRQWRMKFLLTAV